MSYFSRKLKPNFFFFASSQKMIKYKTSDSDEKMWFQSKTIKGLTIKKFH